jgi:TPR repeat protein
MLKVLALLMVTTGVLPVCASADTTQTNTQAENTAVPELLARAERGDAKAQFNLGQIYDTGLGVPQDVVQAVAWWRKAADQGFAQAWTKAFALRQK